MDPKSLELYDNYAAHKGWTEPGAYRPEDYRDLLRQAGLGDRLNLVEIGFGAGTFLDWAAAQGHQIQGLEILPDMLRAAADRGHRVFPAGDHHLISNASIDAVIALDVFEHLSADQIREYLRFVRRVVKPDGLLLVRFPNGDSPFMGRYHYGDLTHDRALSVNSLAQIAALEHFAVRKSYNPRSMPHAFPGRVKRMATYLVRDIVEVVLGYAYFGYRFPMDPNVAATLIPL